MDGFSQRLLQEDTALKCLHQEDEIKRLRNALKEIDECLDGNWSRREMKQIAREALRDE